MANEELLTNFRDQVAEFAKHRTFIERTEGLAENYREEVVSRVKHDHTEKSLLVVEKIIPLVVDVEELIVQLTVEKETEIDARDKENIVVKELELRLAIEELTQEAFDEESAAHQASLDTITASIENYDKDLDAFNSVLSQWKELGLKAGIIVEEAE